MASGDWSQDMAQHPYLSNVIDVGGDWPTDPANVTE